MSMIHSTVPNDCFMLCILMYNENGVFIRFSQMYQVCYFQDIKKNIKFVVRGSNQPSQCHVTVSAQWILLVVNKAVHSNGTFLIKT